ncbi:MAG: hypothetical protein GY830_03960 [Bacteroidetes bacterium]|nr:hypothetical protein [Bacteroidota bacterium]
MHPLDIVELSNALTDAGTGSEMQAGQFTDGKLTAILGAAIISNDYITQGEIFIVPINSTATPDPDLMLTKINN